MSDNRRKLIIKAISRGERGDTLYHVTDVLSGLSQRVYASTMHDAARRATHKILTTLAEGHRDTSIAKSAAYHAKDTGAREAVEGMLDDYERPFRPVVKDGRERYREDAAFILAGPTLAQAENTELRRNLVTGVDVPTMLREAAANELAEAILAEAADLDRTREVRPRRSSILKSNRPKVG